MTARRVLRGVAAVIVIVVAFGIVYALGEAATSATPAPPACRSVVHRAYASGLDEEQPAGIARSAKWGWGAEVDARVTADARVVLVHDDRLTRITGGADTRRPEDLLYREVTRVPLQRGGHPTGIWDAVRAARASGARLLVEVKRYPDHKALWDGGGLDVLVNAIRKQDMTGRVTVGGPAADIIADRYPDIRTYVRDAHTTTPLDEVAGHELVKLLDDAVNADNIAALRAAGHGLTSARVTLTNDPDWVRAAHAAGLRVFFTNKPRLVAQACATTTQRGATR